MRQNDTTTTSLSKEEARNYDDAESYRLIHHSPHYRIGYGTRVINENKPSTFVEVAVTLLHDRPEVSVALLEKDLQIIKGLQARGYTLNCHDDACVSAELCVPPHKMQAECAEIRKMIENIMADII